MGLTLPQVFCIEGYRRATPLRGRALSPSATKPTTGSRPWRVTIPVAETGKDCSIRSTRSLSLPRVAFLHLRHKRRARHYVAEGLSELLKSRHGAPYDNQYSDWDEGEKSITINRLMQIQSGRGGRAARACRRGSRDCADSGRCGSRAGLPNVPRGRRLALASSPAKPVPIVLERPFSSPLPIYAWLRWSSSCS